MFRLTSRMIIFNDALEEVFPEDAVGGRIRNLGQKFYRKNKKAKIFHNSYLREWAQAQGAE